MYGLTADGIYGPNTKTKLDYSQTYHDLLSLHLNHLLN
ncbi:Hypothetical protein ACI5QL_02675 [Bacillus velezensis]